MLVLHVIRALCFPILAVFGTCFLASCKDFKNWKSVYASSLTIRFEPEKDPIVPNALHSLKSKKLEYQTFWLSSPMHPSPSPGFFLNPTRTQEIRLDPSADEVSFTIENHFYYHKVTVQYERIVSLISPEAGGLQQAYVVRNIVLDSLSDGSRSPIFTQFKIAGSIPRKKDKNKDHVTLYY